MKTKFNILLTKIHFSTLLLAIFNYLLNELTEFSLESRVELTVELIAVLSGITLFFLFLLPFKKIIFYYAIYPIACAMLIAGILFRGIFGAIVLSIILFPIIPDQKEFEQDGIIISNPYGGFLATCCSYQMKERKLLFFEAEYGRFESDGPIDFETIKIKENTNSIEISYKTDFSNEIIKKKILK